MRRHRSREVSSLQHQIHTLAANMDVMRTELSQHGRGPVPPELLAAAAAPRRRGQAVRLEAAGQPVIAVIGDEGQGDPSAWWEAIQRLASAP